MRHSIILAILLIAALSLPRGASATEWIGFQAVLNVEGVFDLDGPDQQIVDLRASAAAFLVPHHGVLEFFGYAGPRFHLASEKFTFWVSPQVVLVGRALPSPGRDQVGPSIWMKIVPTQHIAIFVQGDLWIAAGNTAPYRPTTATYYGFYAITAKDFWKAPVMFGAVAEHVNRAVTFDPKVDLVAGPLEISIQYHAGPPQPALGCSKWGHTVCAVVILAYQDP